MKVVLVVEDDAALRQVACSSLRAQGYTVLLAGNGWEAMRLAREHKDAPIHLVIMDFIVPLMSGKVIAEWLKLIYPDIKILLTLSDAEAFLFRNGVPNAGIDFLSKPYTPVSLGDKVREMLNAE